MAELAPPQTHVQRRGRVPTLASSEVGNDGGTVRKLTGNRRPKEKQRKKPSTIKARSATVRPWALGGERRWASVRKQTEGERGPGERRRRGPAAGHAHAREGDERARGPSKNPSWARPTAAERAHRLAINAVTACIGM